MKKEDVILNSIIQECQLHKKRLDFAYSKIEHWHPFTSESIDMLKDEDVSYLDQYIFRFSKLQDALGIKLFKSLLRYFGEQVEDKTFIDLFNRLEQLGIVKNYSIWQNLRIIRNEIAHDYGKNNVELAEKINAIMAGKKELESYLIKVLQYLSKKGWTNGNT